ncbi:hypothetical protein [Echinicola sp. 20G]|uniref:hypothetical protein n=1 Tax=Echinicola sp. 20G TaxID=2781961 RepID=UPI001910CD6E|nr:hypothetical protein [Echinicola sp. 20G]
MILFACASRSSIPIAMAFIAFQFLLPFSKVPVVLSVCCHASCATPRCKGVGSPKVEFPCMSPLYTYQIHNKRNTHRNPFNAPRPRLPACRQAGLPTFSSMKMRSIQDAHQEQNITE